MQEAFRDRPRTFTPATAAQVFGVPPEEVTPLQRRHAKAVNFGIVYGISEFSLAEDIGVSRYEAKAYIDTYLDKYAGVRAYMQRDCGGGQGPAATSTTLFGRTTVYPGAEEQQLQHPPGRGANRPEHAHSGHGGGPHQAGHGPGGPGAGGGGPAGQADSRRSTMS